MPAQTYSERMEHAFNGFSSNGFNSNEVNSTSFNSNGSNSNGFNSNVFSSNGFNSNGFNSNGFDKVDQASQSLKSTTLQDVDAEFLTILKSGIRLSDPVLDDILEVHSPMVLGPTVGSPVGALAGAILAAAGKIAANTSAPVNEFRQGLTYDGVVERAILGEAAICAVMSMKTRRLAEIGVLAEMAKVVKQLAPATKKIAPFIMHTLTGVALRISLDALSNGNTKFSLSDSLADESSSKLSKNDYNDATAGRELTFPTFVPRLSRVCDKLNGTGNASNDAQTIIQIGFGEAGPVLTNVASSGLQTLSTALPDHPAGGETGDLAHHPHIEGLPERAMLGEAALQALMNVQPRDLDESAFDIMARTIAKIGLVVARSSHGLMEDIAFIIKAAVVAPAATGTTSTDEGVASKSQRGKRFSGLNLESEVLDYYRTLETKPMQTVYE